MNTLLPILLVYILIAVLIVRIKIRMIRKKEIAYHRERQDRIVAMIGLIMIENKWQN